MLTTPTHHHRRRRAGAVVAALGLGLPVGLTPALAETFTAGAQVEVEASAVTDAGTADSDDEWGSAGAAQVDADVSVDGYLGGLLDGSAAGPNGTGIADTALLSDVAASAAATGALALDIAEGGVGSGDGEPGGLPGEVLGILLSGDGEAGLPGIGLPGSGLPSSVLPGGPGVGLPNLGLPGGVPGLAGLGVPGLGLPGLGLPGGGLPALGLPGFGLPSLPDRLPSLVLPSVLTAPSGQDDDPAAVDAGHAGPVGGLVNATEETTGAGPAPVASTVPASQLHAGPAQPGGGSPGSLPRTGADLRLRALAAFGLLGLAGLGNRRRRSA